MAFQLKQVSFGESEIQEFMLPKKKDRNACVMGEHHTFWQRHESLERREHKRLSKRTHAMLALGRGAELRAAVEEYMTEPVLQVQQQQEQQCVAKSRRPPPPARRRSRSVGHSKVKHVSLLQGQRALDDQEATSSQMCPEGRASAPSADDALCLQPDFQYAEDDSESEEEEDVVMGHVSCINTALDEEAEPVVLRSKATAGQVSTPRTNWPDEEVHDATEIRADQAQDDGHLHRDDAGDQELSGGGRVSTFREKFLRRRLPDIADAVASQVALGLQLGHDLPLSPEPPRTDDMPVCPPAPSYQRPLRAYTIRVEAAGHD
eukprot:TRINITY_DN3221_c0_g2_i1.p1 TRINITY_DN3221_c0_g2~~TRINITY_DN3221_c0_g2_i1.p1  ORF type:complete len:319 (-),score=53.31 TRINITY_DN3221_c0_g2_i1:408-1364(-)